MIYTITIRCINISATFSGNEFMILPWKRVLSPSDSTAHIYHHNLLSSHPISPHKQFTKTPKSKTTKRTTPQLVQPWCLFLLPEISPQKSASVPPWCAHPHGYLVLGILPGVSVVKQNSSSVHVPASDVVANLARDFPNDVDKRMDAYLMHKIGTYLNSHAISIRLFDPRTFEAARSFNEAALEQLGFGEQRNNPAESGSSWWMFAFAGESVGGVLVAASTRTVLGLFTDDRCFLHCYWAV